MLSHQPYCRSKKRKYDAKKLHRFISEAGYWYLKWIRFLPLLQTKKKVWDFSRLLNWQCPVGIARVRYKNGSQFMVFYSRWLQQSLAMLHASSCYHQNSVCIYWKGQQSVSLWESKSLCSVLCSMMQIFSRACPSISNAILENVQIIIWMNLSFTKEFPIIVDCHCYNIRQGLDKNFLNWILRLSSMTEVMRNDIIVWKVSKVYNMP